MSSTRAPAPPPRLRGLTYVSLLGTGGYSDVFLYEQTRPRRPVAVKVLLAADLTEARRQQFSAEADLMAQVSAHPYIVNIFDADVADDGRSYLVMEYYPRPHLGVRARIERLSVPEVLRIGIQVTGAVETAHRLGILHRDIKPANVLTSQYGRPGLADFGISASTGAQVDDDDRGGMSIPWTAPEVFRPATEPDERCDVYSLGATVWHLLVGRSPFDLPGADNRPLPMMRRIEHDPVPATGRDDVPASLERALAQAMRKNPAGRIGSAFDFARSLQAVQQELRLGVTPIEIPEVGGVQSRPRDDRHGADRDATRLRPRKIETEPHPPGSTFAPPASLQRAAVPERSAAPVRAAGRRGFAVGLGVLAIAAVATVLVLAVGADPRRVETDGSRVRVAVPQDVTAGAFVPVVEGSATRLSSTVVRFSWTAPDPQFGDFYLLTRADSGAGPRVSNQRQQGASYELRETSAPRPCLTVVLVRNTGQASEPATICAAT